MRKLAPDGAPRKRGPREGRGVIADAIVDSARRSFAEHGYTGTSMRSIATDASVDPRLVGYYFQSKERLLEACLVTPSGFIGDVAAVVTSDLSSRGQSLVRLLLRNWEDPRSGPVLRSIILIAAQHPFALQRLQAIVSGSLIGAVSTNLDDDERLLRGGLVATQMLGLAMTRYVWHLEPIASASEEQVVACVAPTIQRYLTGDLEPRGSTSEA
jgi:AcrR family transcriptional regulator